MTVVFTEKMVCAAILPGSPRAVGRRVIFSARRAAAAAGLPRAGRHQRGGGSARCAERSVILRLAGSEHKDGGDSTESDKDEDNCHWLM